MHVAERLANELADGSRTACSTPTSGTTAPTARAHYETTGPEIWRQTGGRVDGFVSAIGTGGTLSGVGACLKERSREVVIALADPMGAAMYHWFKHGELQSEGSSITEGIGQGRVTGNVEGARVDKAFQIPDDEALPLLFELLAGGGAVPRRLDRASTWPARSAWRGCSARVTPS